MHTPSDTTMTHLPYLPHPLPALPAKVRPAGRATLAKPARHTIAGPLLACGLAWMAATSQAAAPVAPTATARQIDQRYQAERQACLDGQTGQATATCLREAGAARDQARQGKLDNGETAADLLRNALARCMPYSDTDRHNCERLARGEGQSSGSVAGGGVIREITTRSVAPAVPAPPTPSR